MPRPIRTRAARLLAGAALLVAAGAARAEVAVVKLGVLTDLSGFAADSTGEGSVVAARLAVEDFRKERPAIKVEVKRSDCSTSAL